MTKTKKSYSFCKNSMQSHNLFIEKNTKNPLKYSRNDVNISKSCISGDHSVKTHHKKRHFSSEAAYRQPKL